MKKITTLLLTIGISVFAISFNELPSNFERQNPKDDILLSYNSSIKNSMSSVVYIATKVKPKNNIQNRSTYPQGFFRHNQKQSPQHHGLGSGVIISKDGYIITNNHVIKDASEIIVRLADSNKEYEASVIGADPKSDLAVIKIDASSLNPISFADSSKLEIGDIVFAIGNPFGVGQSVTQGIISAQNKSGVGINEYENFIQTDASINPGNSGGALVDSRGGLIGINTAILTRSGGNNGIGFAIEVNMVKGIVKQLIEDGSVKRALLGVNINDLTSKLKKLYKKNYGAIVSQVNPGSAADEAKIKRGDLIIKIDDIKIDSASELKSVVGSFKPDSKVIVTLERDKQIITLNATLGSLTTKDKTFLATKLEGLQVSNIDEKLRYQLNIPTNIFGAFIQAVEPNSEAGSQGILSGDIIVQIEQSVITNLADLNATLKRYKNSYKKVYINRQGRIYIFALK